MKLIRKDLIDRVIELSRKYGDFSITTQFINYEARIQYREMVKHNHYRFDDAVSVYAYKVFKRYLKCKYKY